MNQPIICISDSDDSIEDGEFKDQNYELSFKRNSRINDPVSNKKPRQISISDESESDNESSQSESDQSESENENENENENEPKLESFIETSFSPSSGPDQWDKNLKNPITSTNPVNSIYSNPDALRKRLNEREKERQLQKGLLGPPSSCRLQSSRSLTSSPSILSFDSIDNRLLWPPHALHLFVKSLTSCSISLAVVHSETLPSKFPLSEKANLSCGGGLVSPWESCDIPDIPLFFASPFNYSSFFSPSLFEECVENICQSIPVASIPPPFLSSSFDRMGGNAKAGGNPGPWVDAELLQVIDKQRPLVLPNPPNLIAPAFDPTFGSVWTLQLYVHLPEETAGAVNLVNGDLLILSHPAWGWREGKNSSQKHGRLLLGVVVGWDPDLDRGVKAKAAQSLQEKINCDFVVNRNHRLEKVLRENKTENKSGSSLVGDKSEVLSASDNPLGSSSASQISTRNLVHVMVSIHTADQKKQGNREREETKCPNPREKKKINDHDGLGMDDIFGSWASPGMLVDGMGLRFFVLANVLTSIREFQAVCSFPYFTPSLQHLLLSSDSPSLSNGTSNQKADSNIKKSCDVMSHDINCEQSSEVEEDKDIDDNDEAALPPSRPVNVPPSLWAELSSHYNPSQLRSMKRACCLQSSESQKHLIQLIQGPPGTGKTSTILGLIAVLFATANGSKGNPESRQDSKFLPTPTLNAPLPPIPPSRKIIVGASFCKSKSKVMEAGGKSTQKQKQTGAGQEILSNESKSVIVAPANAKDVGSGRIRTGPVSIAPTSVHKTRILLCAPSNTAVDELVSRLLFESIIGDDGRKVENLKIVRIGQGGRGGDREAYISPPNLSTSQKRAVESVFLDNLIDEMKGDSTKLPKYRGVGLKAWIGSPEIGVERNGKVWNSKNVYDLRSAIVEEADIVCCTLSGAGSQSLLETILRYSPSTSPSPPSTSPFFHALIIDEACQATEPSSLIPFKYNPQRIFLIGDPAQLPPMINSPLLKHRGGYSRSLFERLLLAGHPMSMLNVQYRMHPIICNYPSQRFYFGKLKTSQQILSCTSHRMDFHSNPLFGPFVFHNFSVPSSIEELEMEGGKLTGSIYNLEEAKYTLRLITSLETQYPNVRSLKIGIIAPYSAQRKLIKKLIATQTSSSCEFDQRSKVKGKNQGKRIDLDSLGAGMNRGGSFLRDIEVSTVDGFQGREKDIIIFSCTRAPRRGTPCKAEPLMSSIGFLKEWQRLNVALTRSRLALWIVGHREVLEAARGDRDEEGEWSKLIHYSHHNRYILNVNENSPCTHSPRIAEFEVKIKKDL